jgi:ornithine cyclodeaminase
MNQPVFSALETAERLPYGALAREIAVLLQDPSVQVPPRLVQALPGGGSLFVMPALDQRLAITKLITFTPSNAGSERATIQGDVVVFDIASGLRLFILDGPTVTARRTAAVSLLAAQHLAPNPAGPLLLIGAGAQGRAHLNAFVQGLGVQEVFIASGSMASAAVLADYAASIGVRARVVTDPNVALDTCTLVVTCTPANRVVLHGTPRSDAFIAAVGAFTPSMVEISPALCNHVAKTGWVVLDTPDAIHEAGDLIQARVDMKELKTLRDALTATPALKTGPVLFKSCGWAGWDLAAARTAQAFKP